jgi:hypothetical protein
MEETVQEGKAIEKISFRIALPAIYSESLKKCIEYLISGSKEDLRDFIYSYKDAGREVKGLNAQFANLIADTLGLSIVDYKIEEIDKKYVRGIIILESKITGRRAIGVKVEPYWLFYKIKKESLHAYEIDESVPPRELPSGRILVRVRNRFAETSVITKAFRKAALSFVPEGKLRRLLLKKLGEEEEKKEEEKEDEEEIIEASIVMDEEGKMKSKRQKIRAILAILEKDGKFAEKEYRMVLKIFYNAESTKELNEAQLEDLQSLLELLAKKNLRKINCFKDLALEEKKKVCSNYFKRTPGAFEKVKTEEELLAVMKFFGFEVNFI